MKPESEFLSPYPAVYIYTRVAYNSGCQARARNAFPLILDLGQAPNLALRESPAFPPIPRDIRSSRKRRGPSLFRAFFKRAENWRARMRAGSWRANGNAGILKLFVTGEFRRSLGQVRIGHWVRRYGRRAERILRKFADKFWRAFEGTHRPCLKSCVFSGNRDAVVTHGVHWFVGSASPRATDRRRVF